MDPLHPVGRTPGVRQLPRPIGRPPGSTHPIQSAYYTYIYMCVCVCVCVCVVVVVVVYTVQQPCFFLCVHVLCMNSHLVAVVVVAVVVVVVGVYARASVLEY